MIFKPHAYQTAAINHILTHPEAALLLDMGLGKTVITLTAAERLLSEDPEIRRILIIAPLRVAENTWPAELRKWDHLSRLTYAVATGPREKRLAALLSPVDICIINRENVAWLIEQSGVPFDFDMVIVDELSSFKSWQSRRFRSLMKVRPKVRRIVGLTGTPTGNGLMDLYAEFRLLDMGKRLGRSIGSYRDAYFRPEKRCGNIIYTWAPRPGAEEEIHRRISDITISMRACENLPMPRLISNTVEVEMSPTERRIYDALHEDLTISAPEGEITASSAAALAGKLLQLSGGAIYLDDPENTRSPRPYTAFHSRKLDALEDILEGMNGRPLLIAFWFRHEYSRIAALLDRLGITWAKLDSMASIDRWNRGELQAALIHPASAGHGLNLQQGGNTIVWFTPVWSLELYQQTNARLFRQGQTSRTVVITHLITKDTIDARVLSALSRKDKVQKALIEAVKAELRTTKNNASENLPTGPVQSGAHQAVTDVTRSVAQPEGKSNPERRQGTVLCLLLEDKTAPSSNSTDKT